MWLFLAIRSNYHIFCPIRSTFSTSPKMGEISVHFKGQMLTSLCFALPFIFSSGRPATVQLKRRRERKGGEWFDADSLLLLVALSSTPANPSFTRPLQLPSAISYKSWGTWLKSLEEQLSFPGPLLHCPECLSNMLLLCACYIVRFYLISSCQIMIYEEIREEQTI